jgi:FAD/FMN-containing dehydrogenase
MRPEHLARLPVHPADEGARAAVLQMREELAALFVQEGAVSMQLGKFYHYDKALKPEAWALLQKMKSVVDPARVVNPGALKL